jgi:hypothetical protein
VLVCLDGFQKPPSEKFQGISLSYERQLESQCKMISVCGCSGRKQRNVCSILYKLLICLEIHHPYPYLQGQLIRKLPRDRDHLSKKKDFFMKRFG